MGIIKASLTAIGSATGDQWKEAFICDGMDAETLLMRATRITGSNSSNRGNNNIITEGSIIIVGKGECAIVTENSNILGLYDQPGEQTFRSEKSSGFFSGKMRAFSKDVMHRIAFGGDAPYFQRVLYINTKELLGNSFSANNVPFHFRDERAGIDIDGSISCSISYSFHIVDPACFYKKYARASVDKSRTHLVKQMNAELTAAFGPALNSLMKDGVRPSEMLQHLDTLRDKLAQAVNKDWLAKRGIEACSIAVASLQTTDSQTLQTAQRNTAFMDPARAAAHLVGSSGDALGIAAKNPSGSAPLTAVVTNSQHTSGSWKCPCGTVNTGKFCTDCGTARPVRWLCSCGSESSGKFCENCGKKKSSQT